MLDENKVFSVNNKKEIRRMAASNVSAGIEPNRGIKFNNEVAA